MEGGYLNNYIRKFLARSRPDEPRHYGGYEHAVE